MISVICCTIRDDFIENVFRNYLTQTVRKKELIIILNRDDMNLAKWKEIASVFRDISVYQFSKETSLGECLNFGVQMAKYDIITKFDDDDYYAPDYLSNQLKAMKKTKADVVCKRTVYMYFEKEKKLALHLPKGDKQKFMDKSGGIKGSTLMMKKRICQEIKFPLKSLGEDTYFLRNCVKKKYKIYTTDEKNYVCLRRSENNHTWKQPNYKLLEESKIVCKTKNYKKVLGKKKAI